MAHDAAWYAQKLQDDLGFAAPEVWPLHFQRRFEEAMAEAAHEATVGHGLMFPPHPDGFYIASALCICGTFQWDAENEADLEVHRSRVIEDWLTHVRGAAQEAS